MQQITTIKALRSYRQALEGGVGLVATMGALHAGHLSLVAAAKQASDYVLVSIFVNPTQFNQGSDLDKYPKTLAADLQQLAAAGVDAVFLPDFAMMYPDEYQYQLTENSLSLLYCGAHRPGHFDGVLTVLMKLFNLIQPNQAYFGEKDYQQLILIRGLVKTFFVDIQIVACPIIREADGLAMSSRNLGLTPVERKIAPQLFATLMQDSSLSQKRQHLNAIGFDVDYLEVLDDRLLAAASLGEIRLIDNISIDNLPSESQGVTK